MSYAHPPAVGDGTGVAVVVGGIVRSLEDRVKDISWISAPHF